MLATFSRARFLSGFALVVAIGCGAPLARRNAPSGPATRF